MKRVLLLFVGILLMFGLVGCYTAEDLYPKVYGDWEGNYLYISNYRMKTSGEDFTTLITEVEIDNQTYNSHFNNDEEVAGFRVIDYFYHSEFIFLLLEYFHNKAFLARYDLINNDYQVLYNYFLGSKYGFFKQFPETFLFYGNNNLVHMDYEGNIIDENASRYEETYLYRGNYMFHITENNIQIAPIGIENFEVVYTIPEDLKIYQNRIELIGDKLYMKYYTSSLGYEIAYSIIQIDINTKKVVPIYIDKDTNTGAYIISNDYFITYKLKRVVGSFGVEDILRLENKLYKINDNGNHKLLHTFKKNREFLYRVNVVGKNINFTSFHYGKKSLFDSELETKYYRYHFNTNLGVLLPWEKKSRTKTPSSRDLGVTVGDYIFYHETKKYGPLMGDEYFYFLKRYNKKTKETETMFYVQKGIQTNISSPTAIDIFTGSGYLYKREYLILPY